MASIPWLQSALNFFMKEILIRQACSQIFNLFHCFKGFITYLYVDILSCILISSPQTLVTPGPSNTVRRALGCGLLPQVSQQQKSLRNTENIYNRQRPVCLQTPSQV